jgi:hypothetical protein
MNLIILDSVDEKEITRAFLTKPILPGSEVFYFLTEADGIRVRQSNAKFSFLLLKNFKDFHLSLQNFGKFSVNQGGMRKIFQAQLLLR